MPKDYYLILGLSSKASSDEVRSAFRALAKRYHPDGGGSEQQFMEVHEAYAVLSDPERRRDYDAVLIRESIFRVRRPRARHRAPPGHGPEPLRAGEWPVGEFLALNSFVHGWLDRWEVFEPPLAGAPRAWSAEVTLSEEEAARGGQVTLRLPLRHRCPVCHGRGGVMFYSCSHCAGAGWVESELPLVLEFPPDLPDNYTWQMALDRHGVPGGRLTLKFRVTIDE